MFVGTIKKDVTKALQELISEGMVNQLITQIVEKLVKNTEVAYNMDTQELVVRFKKEF